MILKYLFNFVQINLLFIFVTSKCDTSISCPLDTFFDNESCNCLNIFTNCEKETLELCAHIQCETSTQKLTCPLTCNICNTRKNKPLVNSLSLRSNFSFIERVKDFFKNLIRNVCIQIFGEIICANLFDLSTQTTTTIKMTTTTIFQGT
jgi:hypothetical protein